MKRITLIAVLLGLATTALSPMGCVDNDKSFVILFAVPPTTDACEYEYQDTANATFLSSGLLDLNYSLFNGQPSYYVRLQAHNYLLNDSDENNGRLNSKDIQLDRYEIRYKWMYGRELLDQSLLLVEDRKIELPASGTVGAASSPSDPGKLLFGMTIIPSEIGTMLVGLGQDGAESAILGVKIRVVGTTLGGTRVESNEFVFPIYFCWGCLDYSCPCGGLPTCTPGQDYLDATLCSECSD